MAKSPLPTWVNEETRKDLIMVVRVNQNQNVSSVVRNTGAMSVKQRSLKCKGKNSLSIKTYASTVDGVDMGGGVTKQSLPIYEIEINALDGKARERIEVRGSKLPDFTTVNRPAIPQLREKYEHMKNKTFYYTENGNCKIHLIIGDKTMRTKTVCKGGGR